MGYKLQETDLLLGEILLPSERRYVLRIKDLPSDEKPREKLKRLGPETLTTSELVAVILGTGTKKEGVLSISSRLIKEYGERSLVSQRDVAAFAAECDIPLTKAMQIVACSELGRRFFQERVHGLAVLRTAREVYEYAQDMRSLPKEHLRGIYLNTHHRVIHDEVISMGTVNTNIIHPREVLKPAIEHGAAALILMHNHPSGIVTPSDADIEITKQLVTAGKIIGIHILDHVIVGKDGFASVPAAY